MFPSHIRLKYIQSVDPHSLLAFVGVGEYNHVTGDCQLRTLLCLFVIGLIFRQILCCNLTFLCTGVQGDSGGRIPWLGWLGF